MSDITGKGYGSSHDWEAGWTGPSRATPYACRACEAAFNHHYPSVPNIFKAMKLKGVPDKCPGLKPAQDSKP